VTTRSGYARHPRSSRSAVGTAWPRRSPPCKLLTDRVHRRRHGRRRRRLVGSAARRVLGPAPGDLRMALAALCDDTEWGHTWRDVLQHRFPGRGPLAGHALGNPLIVSSGTCSATPSTASTSSAGCSTPAAGSCRWPASRSRSRPRSWARPRIPRRHHHRAGQHRVASSRGRVQGVRLLPPDPGCPTRRSPQSARRTGSSSVRGPGSHSIMPHFLVPSLRDAIVSTRARRVLNLNLEVHTGETKGYRAQDHIDSLVKHAPELRFDVVLGRARAASTTPRRCVGPSTSSEPSSSSLRSPPSESRASTTRCAWPRPTGTSSPETRPWVFCRDRILCDLHPQDDARKWLLLAQSRCM
jgi:2-phospho-L-lactate transferase/gluconeogenesis factor (CofD/UPF0052 family)